MKKLLAVLAALLLLLAFAVLAEEVRSNRFEYRLLENGDAEITYCYGSAETLDIPSELDGHKVIAIDDRAFENYIGFTFVTIPESITSIGANPFCGFYKLKNIYVSPENEYLAAIDSVLFSKPDRRLVCYPGGLTQAEYSIPKGIRIIGDFAFSICDSLTSVTIPNSVMSIGANPFAGCNELTTINVFQESEYLEVIDGVLFSKPDRRLVCYPRAFTQEEYFIPEGIKIIGDYAFCGCDSLESVLIPDSVTSIGDLAFSDCYILTTVTIPDSVTSIGDGAFFGCYSLTSVTIPDSVTSIDDDAFDYCSNHLVFTVVKGSYAADYCKKNGYTYQYTDALDWLID